MAVFQAKNYVKRQRTVLQLVYKFARAVMPRWALLLTRRRHALIKNDAARELITSPEIFMEVEAEYL